MVWENKTGNTKEERHVEGTNTTNVKAKHNSRTYGKIRCSWRVKLPAQHAAHVDSLMYWHTASFSYVVKSIWNECQIIRLILNFLSYFFISNLGRWVLWTYMSNSLLFNDRRYIYMEVKLSFLEFLSLKSFSVNINPHEYKAKVSTWLSTVSMHWYVNSQTQHKLQIFIIWLPALLYLELVWCFTKYDSMSQSLRNIGWCYPPCETSDYNGERWYTMVNIFENPHFLHQVIGRPSFTANE